MSPCGIGVNLVFTVRFQDHCRCLGARQRRIGRRSGSICWGTLEIGQTSPQLLSSVSMGLMKFDQVGAALMFSTKETSSL